MFTLVREKRTTGQQKEHGEEGEMRIPLRTFLLFFSPPFAFSDFLGAEGEQRQATLPPIDHAIRERASTLSYQRP